MMANNSNWEYMPLKQKDSTIIDSKELVVTEEEIPKVIVTNSNAVPYTPNNSKPNISHHPIQNSSQDRRRSESEGAPLARIEFDDEREDGNDDREVVNRPYPGVDDGFFPENGTPHEGNSAGNPDDVEFIPKPKDPEEMTPHTPELTPRLGPDGEHRPPDEPPPSGFPLSRDFPDFHSFKPHFIGDEEAGTPGETIPDVNVYQHKKTLAQGMMDLALFSANANQLRYVLENFDKSHPYSIPSLVLISLSLILQVVIGAGLVWNATLNIRDQKALCLANKVNNMTTIGVFFVTVINVFISAFGITTNPTTT